MSENTFNDTLHKFLYKKGIEHKINDLKAINGYLLKKETFDEYVNFIKKKRVSENRECPSDEQFKVIFANEIESRNRIVKINEATIKQLEDELNGT